MGKAVTEGEVTRSWGSASKRGAGTDTELPPWELRVRKQVLTRSIRDLGVNSITRKSKLLLFISQSVCDVLL